MKKQILGIIAVIAMGFSFNANAQLVDITSKVKAAKTEKQIEVGNQKIVDLEKRIADLEGRVVDNEDAVDETASELDGFVNKKNFTIGGYMTLEYHARSLNKSSTKNDNLRVRNWSLFMEKKGMAEGKIDVFAELELENTPLIEGSGTTVATIDGKIFLEQAYMDYHITNDPTATLRVGRMITKFGLWSEDHYYPWVETQSRPLLLRNVFPQVVDGAAVWGQSLFGNSLIHYAIYAGNGGFLAKNTLPSSSNNTGGWNYGTQLYVTRKDGDVDWRIGTSFYGERVRNDVGTKDISMKTYGVDTKVKYKGATLKAEATLSKNNDHLLGVKYNTIAGYAQVAYDVTDKWIAGYRYDYFNDKHPTGAGVARNGKTIVQIPFINYKVSNNARVKLEYLKHDKLNKAKDELVLGTSIGF